MELTTCGKILRMAWKYPSSPGLVPLYFMSLAGLLLVDPCAHIHRSLEHHKKIGHVGKQSPIKLICPRSFARQAPHMSIKQSLPCCTAQRAMTVATAMSVGCALPLLAPWLPRRLYVSRRTGVFIGSWRRCRQTQPHRGPQRYRLT